MQKNYLSFRTEEIKAKCFNSKAVSILMFSLMTISCKSQAGESKYSSSDSGWISLFNRKGLPDWTELGGKTQFAVKGGKIMGTTVPGPNSILCTNNSSYSNFVLELGLKIEPSSGSGVQQIRSYLNKKSEGYGYQNEVDPSERTGSGDIYDCRTREWMIALKSRYSFFTK